MFKFEDIIVGTKGHELLIDRLGDLARENKEVRYEEYVTHSGEAKKQVVRGEVGPYNSVTLHDQELKCRGYAIP